MTTLGEESSVELLGENNIGDIAGEDLGGGIVEVAHLSDIPAEKTFGSGHIDIGDALEGHHFNIVDIGKIGLQVVAGVGVVETGEGGIVGIEKENTATASCKFVNLVAFAIVAFASTDEQGVFIQLSHAADGEGDLLIIKVAREVVPDVLFGVGTGVEAASSSASVKSDRGVGTTSENDEGSDTATNVVRADFNKIVVLVIGILGGCCANKAHCEARK